MKRKLLSISSTILILAALGNVVGCGSSAAPVAQPASQNQAAPSKEQEQKEKAAQEAKANEEKAAKEKEAKEKAAKEQQEKQVAYKKGLIDAVQKQLNSLTIDGKAPTSWSPHIKSFDVKFKDSGVTNDFLILTDLDATQKAIGQKMPVVVFGTVNDATQTHKLYSSNVIILDKDGKELYSQKNPIPPKE